MNVVPETPRTWIAANPSAVVLADLVVLHHPVWPDSGLVATNRACLTGIGVLLNNQPLDGDVRRSSIGDRERNNGGFHELGRWVVAHIDSIRIIVEEPCIRSDLGERADVPLEHIIHPQVLGKIASWASCYAPQTRVPSRRPACPVPLLCLPCDVPHRT